MKRRKLIVLLGLIIIAAKVQAQDPHFSQFFASPLTLNPAFTGKFNGQWRLAANHRNQWPSISNAYITSSASIDFPVLKKNLPAGDVFGIGISGVSDASANNILKLNYGSVSLSYHKALDEDGYHTIGAGFQGTYSSMSLDVSKLIFEDMLTQNGFTGTTSDIITNGNNQSYAELNAGLLYSGSSDGINNFYLGASMYHINRPKVGFKDKNWYLSGRVTIHAGGALPISDILSLNASAIHQVQAKAHETIVGAAVSANLNGDYQKPTSVYFGSWMRFNDALIPYAGLEFAGLRIGTSYDINISNLKTASNSRGGMEVSLIYIKQSADSKLIPCPKF
ncbi:MAG: PorP/SprF family type IX secretion system membrane protein [Chitinophagaceae bacterium]|nr:PorP/SprF family type IX secretion system membrane protein [Chitinophagaceae bacterium]